MGEGNKDNGLVLGDIEEAFQVKQARMFITAVALSAILMGSAGCASQTDVTRKPPMSEMTLIAAKNIALAAEDETAALVPPENIAKSDQFKTASLLSCSADEYEWPGQTTVTLTGELDRQGLIDTIRRHWAAKPGYTAEVTKRLASGEPRITISGDDGATYFVEFWYKDTELQISSFSPCFKLAEGNSGDEY